jgi:arylsulfatase A-like enzyme
MKKIISLFSIVCLLSIFITSCKGKQVKEAAVVKEKKRPNFLFVLVDDQSPFDLKTYDPNSILETPNIDKLAEGGIVFDQARNMGSMNGAVCTPSRHMIMSGRTVWNLPKSAEFQTNTEHNEIDDFTMGAVFNNAGYN